MELCDFRCKQGVLVKMVNTVRFRARLQAVVDEVAFTISMTRVNITWGAKRGLTGLCTLFASRATRR